MSVYTATVNGITWRYTLNGSNASIGNNTNSGGNATTTGTTLGGNPLIIPADLSGNPVTAIGQYAFYNCEYLNTVNIPNSVTSIGQFAFNNCFRMTSINIPNSVTTISTQAFRGCGAAVSLTIGSSVASIGSSAFYYCGGIKSLSIPNSVISMSDGAFASCIGLTSLTIGNSLTSLNPTVFLSCTGLTSVTIPNTVNSIGQSSFSSCTGLTSVTIGNTVTYIGYSAFQFCSNLISINIPNSVANIMSNAFDGTSQNLTVTMNNGKFNFNNLPLYSQSFFGNTSVDLILPPQPSMTIESTTVTSGSTTNNASIALTFTSSLATSNFVLGDISGTNGTLSGFAGSGTVYNATFTPAGQGACTIKVNAGVFTADSGDGYNTASNTFTWTLDSVSPSMTITSTTADVISGSTTNNSYIALTFTSTEATTNFGVGDITVTNGTLSNFDGSGNVYNATFTPATEGACTINVPAGVYTDAVGNSNIAATQFNWTFSTGWNIDKRANHIIKSYVKDFVDVSGTVVLRENSNLYINGTAETAGNLILNRLFVTADASFNRRIFVGGDVSMNGNVAVSGDLSMNGTVTKCSFNNGSIPKSAFSSAVPDGADYTSTKIVYDQTFQSNDDVSMNGATFASNNVIVSGNIVFSDGTVMNTADNNILSTNPTVFKPSTFTALDICGNLVAGSYATSSDYRIKTNVVELDKTYTVDKLRPVKYFQTQINREKYGLIAHELQEHYPDLVVGEKDGNELQRVNYTGLIAILINEIKRLKRKLTEMENEIVVARCD